jgi:3-hydroxyacyl-[acyl-carrier-protein] dehydratase
MQYYEHDLKSVQDYLHHRPPYLLVDRIVSVSADDIQTEKLITGDEFFMEGHFPGTAIFPGAMMQELSTQSAGILIAAKYNPMQEYNTHDPDFNKFALGVLVRVKNAKFKGFARPGDRLLTHVILNDHTASLYDFSATISIDGQAIMKNSFRLTNVESKVLHGS